MIASFAADAFTAPLVDLGEHESRAFDGVLAPRPEIGAERPGASATFLDNAEAYYERHQGFDYWKRLYEIALRHVGVTRADLIVEYGCGFGNGTLPLLELFPRAKVIATDISPNLLAILKRLLDARGLSDRCVPVALDAHKPYVRDGIADLVAGSAILHHLAEPGELVKAAMRVLKPGGHAVFFEPFEAGHALLRILIAELSRKAVMHQFASPALTWLGQLSAEWRLQIQRDRLPGWRDLDDKWLFPRSVLQKIADNAGAELIISPLGNESGLTEPFRAQLLYKLKEWCGVDPHDPAMMPPWAWDIVSHYDNEFLSDGAKEDLLFEGCVIFRKRPSFDNGRAGMHFPDPDVALLAEENHRLRTAVIPELRDAMAALQHENNRLNFEEVPALREAVAALQHENNRLNFEEVPALREAVAALQHENNRLKFEEVPALQEAVAALRHENDQLKFELVPALKQRTDAANTDLLYLQKILDDLKKG